MEINNFKWTRKPDDFSIESDRIEITTAPYTDLWQRTYYHFQNDNAPVLPNIMIKCSHNHCKRVMFLKNFTEKKLIESSVNGKLYM